MRRPFSHHRSVSSAHIRFVSFVLCYSLVSPGFAAMHFRYAVSGFRAKQPVRVLPNQPLPTPTPEDGKRQPSAGPYVPPALRADNAERRASGREGIRVEAPETSAGTPASNLPNLEESRKTEKSPDIKAASSWSGTPITLAAAAPNQPDV